MTNLTFLKGKIRVICNSGEILKFQLTTQELYGAAASEEINGRNLFNLQI